MIRHYITRVDIERDLFGAPFRVRVSGQIDAGHMGDTDFSETLDMKQGETLLEAIRRIEKNLEIAS